MKERNIFLGITGASGVIYGVNILKELHKKGCKTYLSISEWGKELLKYETGLTIEELKKFSHQYFENKNLAAPVSSGSFKLEAVIVAPCSMATLAEIASGYSKSLIGRVADVALKEGRKLILVPRETPLNAIHLQNMLKLSKLGAVILVASPAFYHKPSEIQDLVNFIVGKVLDQLDIKNDLFKRWYGSRCSIK